MNPHLFSLLERVHGHAALLGLALLLHPVFSLRAGRLASRGTRIAAGLSAALIALPSALGWWLYPTYRREIKPGLRQDMPALMWAFESKEHLAFGCLCLTLGGAALLLARPRHAPSLRLARHLLAAAFVCGGIAGGIGFFVAGGTPAW
ncbi:MAG: hypothetical protein VX899_08115 [Myxococcota bacterium]|nr:hypothetical protein [Myxococcota bacterium]